MRINTDEAYRLVLEKINEFESDRRMIVAIDGRAASGKTTFASRFGYPVIHTDDFYRPRVQGQLMLDEYSGNFDVERFKGEVAEGIANEKSFEYRVFNCKSGRVTETVCVPYGRVLIIEGAYCMHPDNGLNPDVSVFFTVSFDEQKRRIINRNGNDAFKMFQNVWIPAEERYFKHFDIENKIKITVNTEE